MQYLPRLHADGWRTAVSACSPASDVQRNGPLGAVRRGLATAAQIPNRLWAALRAPAYDLVFILREVLPQFTPAAEEFVRLLNRTVIFDFDDAVHLNYADRDVNPLAGAVSIARTVITANEFLGEWALRHNDNVWVLPTPIDTDRFKPDPAKGDGQLLVWSGHSSGLADLKFVRDALIHTRKKYKDLTLRIVCDRKPDFDIGIPIQFVPWSPGIEVDAVRSADIGIMPMADDEWTKGKSGYKLLQYMACGLPSIAAPWGVISDVIDAGRCGLPAQDTEEWIEALDKFVGEASLREMAGKEARRRAEEIYSINAIYPRWRDVLAELVEQKVAAAVPSH